MLPREILNKKVLVAPLDWGMGHVTRCIPLIQQFISQNCIVTFAGTEAQIGLINKDFPELETEQIAGYGVQLDSTKSTYRQVFSQFLKLKKIAKAETEIAQRLATKHSIDVIISDNRYGFRSNECINVFITHQLSPQVPFFADRVSTGIRKYVNGFDFCWIPDCESHPLCGKMVKGELKIPKLFIGWLSRFKKMDVEILYDYLIIISGPEPERSNFQNKINQVFSATNFAFLIISTETKNIKNGITNPSTQELEQLINQSKTVISRAGYTSIMELESLEKSSLLVPTKGQYEQLYLAENHQSNHINFISEDELYVKITTDN